MGNRIATIAFVLGLLAVGMAAFQNNFVQETQRPLSQVAADAARTLLEEKVLHKPPPPPAGPQRRPLHPYQMVFTSLGVLAMGLGTYAWSQKAHHRLAASAIGLGLIAIAWEWVLIAVAVAVALFVLSVLM